MFNCLLLLYSIRAQINSIAHFVCKKHSHDSLNVILLIQDHSLYSNIMIRAWKISCNMVSFTSKFYWVVVVVIFWILYLHPPSKFKIYNLKKKPGGESSQMSSNTWNIPQYLAKDKDKWLKLVMAWCPPMSVEENRYD